MNFSGLNEKNVEKTQHTEHMMDVLIKQHAKWTARCIERSLFGQTLIDFSTNSWPRIFIDNIVQKATQKRGTKCINFQSIPILLLALGLC